MLRSRGRKRVGHEQLKRPKNSNEAKNSNVAATADISDDVGQLASTSRSRTKGPVASTSRRSGTRSSTRESSQSQSVETPTTSTMFAPPPPPSKRSKRNDKRADDNPSRRINPDNFSDDHYELPRQRVTKLKFPQPMGKKGAGNSKKDDFSLDEPGIKESLEICQGFSKLKIDDWYPFFDVHHNKSVPAATTSPNSPVDKEKDASDSDEWEETLVYVDLADVPDIDGLFSSLASRRPTDDHHMDDQNEAETGLSHLEMKIFNMDSDLPVILLGGKYLTGRWEDTIGTSLFFKRSEGKEDSSPIPHTSSSSPNLGNLKNIVPEPEIPFDPIFGEKYLNSKKGGYELVAKCLKVLKAKHFPVVNDEVKREDVIRDADDEFDHRDFQIPPVSMVREFMPGMPSYEKLLEEDIKRRREIRKKWSTTDETNEGEQSPVVKTEPQDPPSDAEGSDDGSNIYLSDPAQQ